MIVDRRGKREIFGGEAQTTNNRMELTAVIRALERCRSARTARVHTDSQYVQQGISLLDTQLEAQGLAAPQSKNRSRTRTCGAGWTSRRGNTDVDGYGSRACRVIRGTSGRTSWRTSALLGPGPRTDARD
jgi:ribonuclease HI